LGNRLEQEVRSQKSEVRIKPALTLTFQAEPVGNPMPLSFPDSEYPPHQFCRTQPHEDYAALGNPTPQEFA